MTTACRPNVFTGPMLAASGRTPRKVIELVVSIETAGVRQKPDARGSDHGFLRPDPGPRVAEAEPVGAQAERRQPARLPAQHLASKSSRPRLHLLGAQLVGASRRASHDVRDPQAQAQKLVFL